MGEYTFRIFRKLLCTTLILSLLWPDLAKCMEDEEENLNYPSIPHNLLQNNTSDQKRGLQLIDQKESLPSILLRKDTTSSEDPKNEDNPENNSEKTHVSEEITNKEENPSENKIPSEDTNTSSHESKQTEEKKEDNKNTETVSLQTIPLPKENESHKEIKKEENNLLQESIEIFEEGEEGGSGGKTVKFIETVEEDEKFSEKTQSFLSYFKKRIIDGWPTWRQVVGAGIGTVIGVGVGVGTWFLFIGDLFEVIYLPSLPSFLDYPIEYLNNNGSFYYIVGVAGGLDAIMRGAGTLISVTRERGQAFLSSEELYKKNLIVLKLLVYGGAFISSSLPLYYLYFFKSTTFFTPSNFWPIWSVLSLAQVLDTLFAYGKSLSDQSEKWIKKKALQKRLKTLLSSSEEKEIETQRQFYVDTLKKLMWILYKLPDEQIKQLYEEVVRKKKNGEISEVLKALEVLEALLKIYESYEGKNPVPSQQAKKKQASIFGWIVAGLASPGRHLVFWYSIFNLIQNMYILTNDSSNDVNPYVPPKLTDYVAWPLAIIFGGIIGAAIQGYFEKENLSKSYFSITRGKIVTEPQYWKPLRVINKIWNYVIQGPIYSLPYIVTLFTSLATCNSSYECYYELPMPLILAFGIPFFLADAANNATYFNESSGKWISAINRLLSYTPLAKYLKGYQRDKLIEITNSFRELMRDLDPSVVKELHEKLSKKIPNLFKTKIHEGSSAQENSKTEENEPLLKNKNESSFYDHGSIDDMILSNNHLSFKVQKGSMFSSCWRGLTGCYQKIPSLKSCWKGVKKGFTFLFSSCRKSSKDREMGYITEEEEREQIIN